LIKLSDLGLRVKEKFIYELAELLVERTGPELLYLEAKFEPLSLLAQYSRNARRGSFTALLGSPNAIVVRFFLWRRRVTACDFRIDGLLDTRATGGEGEPDDSIAI
jgi:hypothetical protein